MFIKGLGFGMLLQLAVGPVCLFILSAAVSRGFPDALSAVLAVTIVDAAYIFIAAAGIGKISGLPNLSLLFRILGGTVVFLFGLNILLNVFHVNFIPYFNHAGAAVKGGPFFYALVLTAANPMTILFWAGVFGAKIAEDRLDRRQAFLFGLGCLVSTPFFLSLTALLGVVFRVFLPKEILSVLNALVGAALMALAVRIVLKKPDAGKRP